MKYISKAFICLAIFTANLAAAQSLTKDKVISNVRTVNAFPIVQEGRSAEIFVDQQEASVVHIAASAFKNDVLSITGHTPQLLDQSGVFKEYMIIAGTADHSAWMKQLLQKDPSIGTAVKGKWEAFSIQVVNHPFDGVKQTLVICGSDPRGLAYGFFELSRMMGVSPLVWWADVAPEHKKEIYFKASGIIRQSPSVKYRGIFLNDEDWGLQPWAAKNLDKDIGDIGPKSYQKIFELLLRLKGNYIWPAMHPCTKAFWFYKDNPKVASDYGIILGASHCEPMLRNNVFEWAENYKEEYGTPPGEWRYDVNEKQIYTYWEDRVKASSKNEAIYTVGMRGIHDGGMPGPPSLALKVPLLEKVIADQRKMLTEYKPAEQVPQIFCPYKEVLDIYRAGMKLPDDITIVWADDNHGYIRQLSNPQEQQRNGRSGVYYHLSYWGRPADYLWLSSISPTLIAHEMQKAYDFGADRLWVFNVGDIKPAEAEMQFALDLAWDVKAWPEEKALNYTYSWAKETFGVALATEIAAIKNEYYLLAASGKPEHLSNIEFTEADISERLRAYQLLEKQVQAIKVKVPVRLKNAYYELIEYPVTGAMLMNQKIFYAKQSLKLAGDGNEDALTYSARSKSAFNDIQAITRRYNKEIAGGKWDSIMSWKPRDRPIFKMPRVALKQDVKSPLKNKPQGTVKAFQLQIKASDFTMESKPGASLRFLKGLGFNGTAVTVLPVTRKAFHPDSIYTAPYAEYNVKLKAGKYTIDVKALPAFPVNAGLSMVYAISVNHEKPRIVNLEIEADTPRWDTSVLRGYMNGRTAHMIPGNISVSSIRIYFISPGFVMNRVDVQSVQNN